MAEADEGRRRMSLVWAVAHPLRHRILHLIVDGGKPMSPAQIAKAFGRPVGIVVYHANVLRKFEVVEPAGERPAGGTVEQLYDSTVEDNPEIEALLDEAEEVDEDGGQSSR
jgi:hypothetical protein